LPPPGPVAECLLGRTLCCRPGVTRDGPHERPGPPYRSRTASSAYPDRLLLIVLISPVPAEGRFSAPARPLHVKRRGGARVSDREDATGDVALDRAHEGAGHLLVGHRDHPGEGVMEVRGVREHI